MTPDGGVTLHSKPASPAVQELLLLNAEELRQLADSDKTAVRFLSAYMPGVPASLKAYDEAFHRWQRDHASQFSVHDVVESMGAYLGNVLVKDFDMEWVQVTDEFGTDLAVRAKKYEVISFPFSSVAKRIQNKQHEFMVGIYYAVKDVIASDPKAR